MVFYLPHNTINDLLLPDPYIHAKSGVQSSTKHTAVEYNKEGAHVYLDLPGVKLSDVKVQFEDGYLTIKAERHGNRPFKIARQFAIRDHYQFDFNSTEAVLVDGVLTVSIPKKQNVEPKVVPVLNEDPHTELDEKDSNNQVLFSLDLPGVKPADFTAKIEPDGSIVFEAERKTGPRMGKMEKQLVLKHPVQDAKAFLCDGVVTFVLKFVETASETKQIKVSSSASAHVSVKKDSEKLAMDKNEDEDVVVVQDVNEDEE